MGRQYLEAPSSDDFETVEVPEIASYAWVFIGKGSDSSLEPFMLTTHQYMVPMQNIYSKTGLEPRSLGIILVNMSGDVTDLTITMSCPR